MNQLEKASQSGRGELLRLGLGFLFAVAILLYVGSQYGQIEGGYILIVAAIVGGYMAMNIGANDVANNVGPAVGSKALTMTGAIIIAIIFEAAGAIIAGGDVVTTIKKGIIDPSLIKDADTFVWLMLAALLAAAVWLNIATYFGAPVSTTHSIVGGVLGAGIAAGGFAIANWSNMGLIAASWIISPVLGGLIAAFFLYLIKRLITYKDDMNLAATKAVPYMVAFMAWMFSTYLILKGLKRLYKFDLLGALGVGLIIAFIVFLISKPLIKQAAKALSNDKKSVNQLFTLPLIFAAALLSFAHGANDVANAIGPLAAIHDSIVNGGVTAKAAIPLWVMLIGAIGIALGLALYGPKLIKTVGSEITELDQMRAFAIAMAAAITVIIASQLGLPVSSTHIAVGAVFGVGFLREYLKTSYARMEQDIIDHHDELDKEDVQSFLMDFRRASIDDKKIMLKQLKDNSASAELTKKERKGLKKVYKKELVKRSAVIKIAAAWVITVPASALMAAVFYFMIRGIMI